MYKRTPKWHFWFLFCLPRHSLSEREKQQQQPSTDFYPFSLIFFLSAAAALEYFFLSISNPSMSMTYNCIFLSSSSPLFLIYTVCSLLHFYSYPYVTIFYISFRMSATFSHFLSFLWLKVVFLRKTPSYASNNSNQLDISSFCAPYFHSDSRLIFDNRTIAEASAIAANACMMLCYFATTTHLTLVLRNIYFASLIWREVKSNDEFDIRWCVCA